MVIPNRSRGRSKIPSNRRSSRPAVKRRAACALEMGAGISPPSGGRTASGPWAAKPFETVVAVVLGSADHPSRYNDMRAIWRLAT